MFKSQLSHAQRLKQLTVPIQASVIPICDLGLALAVCCAGLPNWYENGIREGVWPCLEMVKQEGSPDARILMCQWNPPSIQGDSILIPALR